LKVPSERCEPIRKLSVTSRIDAGDARIVGRIGARDGGVDAAGDDHAVGVELHHEAPDIAVVAVGVDQHGRLAVGVGDDLGVLAVAGVAGPQHVARIGQERVRAAPDDDVDPSQIWDEALLVLELLELGDEHDPVDALGEQLVDPGLDDRGERLEVGFRL